MTGSQIHSQGTDTQQQISQHQLDYLGEVIRLRLIQEMNVLDTARSHEGKEQITYVADSNIFYFYINTFARNEYLKAIALPQVAKLINDHATTEQHKLSNRRNVSTAVITAEYLFSGHLPGQNRFPIYITDEHAGEFQKRVSEIRNEIVETAHTLTDDERQNLSKRVRRLARRLTKLGMGESSSKEAMVTQLRDILDNKLPELISDYALAEVDRAVNLLHLMEDDVARPLRLAPGLNRALVNRSPDSKRIGEWEKLLQDFHEAELRFETKRNSEKTKDLSWNVSADARALARLEEINEDCRSRGIANRFVLITASTSILSASVFRLAEKKHTIDHSFVRPLIQFIPILNFQDMPNFVKSHDASFRLRTALDGLFQWRLASGNEGWVMFLQQLDIHLRNLNRLGERINSAKQDEEIIARQKDILIALRQERMNKVFQGMNLETFDKSLRNIGDLWSGMVENAIGLNAELLVEHYKRHLGRLAEGLASLKTETNVATTLSVSYEGKQFDLIDKLSRMHLKMAVRLMMANPHSPSGRLIKVVRGARPSLYLGEEDEQALFNIVDLLTAGDLVRAESQLMSFIDHDHLNSAELNLAIATIALRVGLWDNAVNFARQAETHAMECVLGKEVGIQRSQSSKLLAAEATWLAGTARRIAATEYARDKLFDSRPVKFGLKRATEYQKKAADAFSSLDDFLGQARSATELALIDTALIMADLESGEPVLETRVIECWNRALDANIRIGGLIANELGMNLKTIVTRRTRLMAQMALVETVLLSKLLNITIDEVSREFILSISITAKGDMNEIGYESFCCWPVFLELLDFAIAKTSSANSIDMLQKKVEKDMENNGAIATDLERRFAFRILSAFKKEESNFRVI
ncbi:hypothetical protein [Roseibium sp. M-1]